MLVLAAALTAAALVLPLWTVHLVAPQYPEGLGLAIHASTIAGLKPGDLQSINGLNHYIGMRAIVPNAIPELRWMPWITLSLTVIALVAGILGSRRLSAAWCVLVVALGAAGLWDFHRWEYDYGHNLDLADAIIIVPGMNYQPPLIGSRQLLNFTATSWPAAGAFTLGAGFVLGAITTATGTRPRRRIVAVARSARLAERHA